MSIATQIERLQSAKAALAISIENKGVPVPSTTKLDGYAALVDQIQQGGEGDTIIIYGGRGEDKGMSFVDCDGSILASYTLDELDDITTMPVPPAKAGLEFAGWSKSLPEIKASKFGDWVCAKYTLEEDNTLYANIVTDAENCVVQFQGLRSYSSGGSEMNTFTIDWGDETVENATLNASHTYADAGAYQLKVSLEEGQYFTTEKCLFNPKSASYVMGIYIPTNWHLEGGTTYYVSPYSESAVGVVFNTHPDGYVIVDDRYASANQPRVGIFAGSNIYWFNSENCPLMGAPGVFANSMIHAVSSMSSIGVRAFFNCPYIKQVIVRDNSSSGSVGAMAFYNARNLEYFSSYASSTGSDDSNGEFAFAGFTQDNLREVWFGNSCTGFPYNMFDGRLDVKVYLPKYQPPYLSGVTAALDGVTVYVPSDAYSNYELADNWSLLAANNQIVAYNFD